MTSDDSSIPGVLVQSDSCQMAEVAPPLHGPLASAHYDESARVSLPVRFSHLRAYGRSPMHGHHARTQAEAEPTGAMERGTAVHALLFGNRRVIGYPGATRRGKEYDKFALENSDCEILTMSEYGKAVNMAAAVRASSVAQEYMRGVHEKTLLFQWNGLACRTTPDVRGTDFLTELKTSASSDPARFIWHARRMHYHAQLRFQEYGCEQHGIRIRDHWIVCVESDPPHPVTVFHVEPEALEEGEKLLMLWGERLKNSEQSNSFPPYVSCTVPLVWPKDVEFEYGDEAV